MEPAITILSNPSRCEYLPRRVRQLRYEVSPGIVPREYMHRLLEGWRRFGPVLFRPECPSCRMCQSLRVPVESFQPNQSQRRAWKKNHDDILIRIGTPSITSEKEDLLARFHQHGAETKGWPADGPPELDLFVHNPFPTEEWSYYAGDRLMGIGYVDILPEGLSAIYFFHDPVERHRSLGTFNVLAIIASARDRGLPHVYLGYYVEGCRSLEYKGRFRPNEMRRADGQWERLDTVSTR
jgi:leucyl-tRNA---protein transferase